MVGITELAQPLGVIAPPVMIAYQVLIPVLLMAGWALLRGIPRYFLGFCHWVWVRAMPESLLAGAPGAASQVFQGVAASGFEDEHSFRAPGDGRDLRRTITRFYEDRGARVVAEGDDLTFRRGSRLLAALAHLVPCRERDFPQEIQVRFGEGAASQPEVRVQYKVRAFYMIRTRPAGLEKEVRALRDVLAA